MRNRVESQRRNASHELREKFRTLAGPNATPEQRFRTGEILTANRGAQLAALAPNKWRGKLTAGRQEFLERVVSGVVM